MDFASLLQKVVRLKAQGSSSEITAFFEQECPRLVPHTKSVGVLLPQQKGHPGGRTVLRRQGGDGAVRAFAERQMSRFLERASATTNRPQADCRVLSPKYLLLSKRMQCFFSKPFSCDVRIPGYFAGQVRKLCQEHRCMLYRRLPASLGTQ